MDSGYPNGGFSSKRAGAFYAAYFGVFGVLLPYLGPYLQLRGIGAVGIGLITAALSLAKLLYAPLVGHGVDRGVWPRGLLTLHALLAVVSAAALWWLDGTVALGIAFFLLGLGHATVLPLVEAAILERMPPSRYGAVRLWGSVGFIVLATAVAPLLSGGKLVRFPFYLAGILGVLVVTCLPFEEGARPRHEPSSGGSLSPAVWALLVLLTLHQVAHGPYYAFFSITLAGEGYSSTTIGALWSFSVLAEAVAFAFGGRLQDRIGVRRLLGLALLATPFRWLAISLSAALPVLVLAQAGHAFSFALAHLAGIQLVQRAAPPGARRRAQALYSGLTFGLGIVVGSSLAGPVYGRLGGRGAFAVAAIFSTVVFAAWLPLAPRLGSRREDQKMTLET